MTTSRNLEDQEEKLAFQPIPSNDFHAYLALLRPFVSFWQTFSFLRPPGLISTTRAHALHLTLEGTRSKNFKKYKCDVCTRAFSRSNTLVTHKRIHTGEKPFICNICDRTFRQPGNLTRHKLIHTATKSYRCELCTKAFNRLSNLQAHQRIHSKIDQLNFEKCSSSNSEQD